MHDLSRRFPAALVAGVVLAAGAVIVMARVPALPLTPPIPSGPSTIESVPSYRADVLRVIDGDTFEARVAVWPGSSIVTRVRLAGMDAPELHARCGAERRRAEAARAALAELLQGGVAVLSDVRPDKYFGRVVAQAHVPGGPDVSAAMLQMTHGRPYAGGRRQGWS